MWTVLVNDDHAEKFYFEVDIFLPNLPSKRIVYRLVILSPIMCRLQNVYIIRAYSFFKSRQRTFDSSDIAGVHRRR